MSDPWVGSVQVHMHLYVARKLIHRK